MTVIITNARVQGFETLVQLKCDSSSGIISSLQPQPRLRHLQLARDPLPPARHPYGSHVQVKRQRDGGDWNIDAGGSLVVPGLVQYLSLMPASQATNEVDGMATPSTLASSSTRTSPMFGSLRLRTNMRESTSVNSEVLPATAGPLIQSMLSHGVTRIRMRVQVDSFVSIELLQIGLAIERKFRNLCDVRISVFAIEPIFSGSVGVPAKVQATRMMLRLEAALGRAAMRPGAIGSSPYAEGSQEAARRNLQYILDLAESYVIDADFHLAAGSLQELELQEILLEVRKRVVFHSDFVGTHASDQGVYPLRVTISYSGPASPLFPFNSSSIAQLANGMEVYFVGLPNFRERVSGTDGIRWPFVRPPPSTSTSSAGAEAAPPIFPNGRIP